MTKLQQMSSDVYHMIVGRCFPWCYKYITLYRELERCRVKNTQQSWVRTCGAIGRNWFIIWDLHSDHCVIVTS